jgi:hypothetical protein
MNDSMPMCFGEGQSNLVQEISDHRQREQWIGFLEILERLSVEELHYQIRHVAASGLRDAEIRDVKRYSDGASGRRPVLRAESGPETAGPPPTWEQ